MGLAGMDRQAAQQTAAGKPTEAGFGERSVFLLTELSDAIDRLSSDIDLLSTALLGQDEVQVDTGAPIYKNPSQAGSRFTFPDILNALTQLNDRAGTLHSRLKYINTRV